MTSNSDTEETNKRIDELQVADDDQEVRLAKLLSGFFFVLLAISIWYPLGAYKSLGSYVLLGFLVVTALSALVIVQLRLVFSDLEKLSIFAGLIASVDFLLAVSFADYKPLAWEKTAEIIPGVLGFFAALTLAKVVLPFQPDFKRKALFVILSMLAIVAAHGLYQVWGPAGLPGTFATSAQLIIDNKDLYSPQQYDGFLHALQSSRASGRIGSPNIFAGMLLLGLPLCIYLTYEAIQLGQRKIFRLQFIFFSLLTLGILTSSSRGAVLVTVIFAFCFIIGLFYYLKKKTVSPVAACVGFVAMLVTPAYAQTLADRLTNVSTIQQRLYYWEAGLAIFQQNPIFGNGPGSFEYLYPIYRVIGSQETRLAHNWVVEWGVEYGLIGLALIVFWFSVSMVSGFRNKGDGENNSSNLLQKIFLTASLVMGLMHGLVEYTFSFGTFFLLWGVLLGLFAASSHSNLNKRKNSIQPVAIGMIGIFVLLLGYTWYSSAYIKGKVDKLSRQADDMIYLNDFKDAEEFLTLAIETDPENAKLYDQRSYVRGVLLGPAAALKDLEQGAQLNPSSAHLRQRMADYYQSQGNQNRAIEFQLQAIELHPLDGTHRMRAAEMYLEFGEIEKAVEVIELLPELHLNKLEKQNYEGLKNKIGEFEKNKN